MERVKEMVTFYPESGDRPWGRWEVIYRNFGKGLQVKLLAVMPHQALSYQLHQHRCEQWSVIIGQANILLDGTASVLKKGESILIPAGAKHRLGNDNDSSLVVFEVQTGDDLSEEDIIRYHDSYGRV